VGAEQSPSSTLIMPRVSVGVPTYNGGTYLEACLTCLTNQTFEDLEIVVSDNASTDETSDIASHFAASDSRVVHIRAEKTIPAIDNFNLVLNATSSPYFLWRADDDLSSLNYVEALANTLDENRTADLAVAPILRTSPAGKRLVPLPPIDDSDKISKIMTLLEDCHPAWIYGMWRRGRATEDFSRLGDRYPYLWAADHIQMLPTLLRGAVAFAEDPAAEFQQNIVRDATYMLKRNDKIRARRIYRRLAFGLLDELPLSPANAEQIAGSLDIHIEKRVARKPTTPRAIKAWVANSLKYGLD